MQSRISFFPASKFLFLVFLLNRIKKKKKIKNPSIEFKSPTYVTGYNLLAYWIRMSPLNANKLVSYRIKTFIVFLLF